MLPILHDLQERFGYIDDAAIPLIAERSTSPRPKRSASSVSTTIFAARRSTAPVLKICRAESCQAAGCEELVAHLGRRARARSSTAHGDGALDHRDRLLPRPLRALARRAARRRADGAARRGKTRCARRARRRGAPNDRAFYVPADSAALAVGADKVAARARRRGARAAAQNIEIVRTGSRGLYWLEPLVEVETAGGRVGYGPVTPADVGGAVRRGVPRRRRARQGARPRRGDRPISRTSSG